MRSVEKPIAYLALAKAVQATADVLHQTVSAWIIERHHHVSVSQRLRPDSDALDGTIMTIGSLPMLVIPMATKLSEHLFIGDIAQNHAFPSWRDAVARHESHLIVSPLLDAGASREDRRAAAVMTLEAASALACLPGAVGVLWGPSGLFHDRAVIAERRPQYRKTNAELMIRLRWSGRPRPMGDGISVMTRGLAPFTGRELLHVVTDAGPDVVYGRVLAACARLIASGSAGGGGAAPWWDDDRFRIFGDRRTDGEEVLRLEFAGDHLAMV